MQTSFGGDTVQGMENITHIIWSGETHDGYPVQFRWNRSKTINIFTGLIEDGQFTDPVEFDIITIGSDEAATIGQVEAAISDWFNYRRVLVDEII